MNTSSGGGLCKIIYLEKTAVLRTTAMTVHTLRMLFNLESNRTFCLEKTQKQSPHDPPSYILPEAGLFRNLEDNGDYRLNITNTMNPLTNPLKRKHTDDPKEETSVTKKRKKSQTGSSIDKPIISNVDTRVPTNPMQIQNIINNTNQEALILRIPIHIVAESIPKLIIRVPTKVVLSCLSNGSHKPPDHAKLVKTDEFYESLKPTETSKSPQPSNLNAQLKDYQKKAINWMIKRERQNNPRGGILADEMGLGMECTY